MAGRMFGFLFMLALSLVFGTLGSAKLLGMAQIFVDGQRAKDWIAVPAIVLDEHVIATSTKRSTFYRAHGTYRYEFAGKPYTSTRLAIDRVLGHDFFGSWDAGIDALAKSLKAARQSGATVTAYVNPSDPREAVLDREARADWLYTPLFVLLVGAALAIMIGPAAALFRPSDAERAALSARDARDASGRGRPIASGGSGGLLILWIIAIFWNAMAVPSAFVFMPIALKEDSYWLVGLVVILLLVGVAFLWGMIHMTWTHFRLGKATLVLDPAQPRVGAALQGVVRFERPKPPGEGYQATVKWARTIIGRSGPSAEKAKGATTVPARVTAAAGGGTQLEFRAEVPADAQPTEVNHADHTHVNWHVEVVRKPSGDTHTFMIDVLAHDAPQPPPLAAAQGPSDAQGSGDTLEAVRARSKRRTTQALVAVFVAHVAIGALVLAAAA